MHKSLMMVRPRLLVWYTVFIVAFRCPSSLNEVTEHSSPVCKPYLTTRSYISPYVAPYYDAYAAPYVDTVRPYIDQFEKHVYRPSLTFTKQSYTKYGAARVDQALELAKSRWETTLRPRTEAALANAKEQYDASVAPYVSKVSALTSPYYNAVQGQVLRTYYSQLLPAYAASRPYVGNAYHHVNQAVIETGIPYAQLAWTTSVVFFDRTIWPRVRILYGKNVEPQLVRIGERLGRYRDGKKLKAAMEEVNRYAYYSIDLDLPGVLFLLFCNFGRIHYYCGSCGDD